MQLVGGELKNYKVLLALFCFVFYESIWGGGGGVGGGGGHVYRSRANSRTQALSDSAKT